MGIMGDMTEKILHIYPIDDLLEHCTDGDAVCDCCPVIRKEGWTTIVIHNSWDGRKYFEVNASKNVLPL